MLNNEIFDFDWKGTLKEACQKTPGCGDMVTEVRLMNGELMKVAAEKAEKEATETEAKSAEEEKEIEVADAPEEEVATEKTEENTAESDE